MLLADRLDPSIRFDLIVANILSGTLIELESDLRSHSQSGTDIALSGILTSQADEVVSTYEQWIHLKRSAEQGDWVILTGAIN